MPVVPVYGQPKVEQRPISGAKRTNAPGPEAFGAQLGDTIERIGATFGNKLADDARQQADEIALTNFSRQADEWEHQRLNDAKTGVLNTVRGQDAYGLASSVTEEFDKFSGALIGKLTPRQQTAAMRLADRKRSTMLDVLDRHASVEGQKFDQGVVEGSLTNSDNLAIANATTPARVAEELAKQALIIEGFAQRQGMSPEQRDMLLAAKRTKTHEGVITQLLALGLDQRAQAYFDETKDQINGTQLPGLEAKLETASSEGAGLRTSDAIWQQLGPKTETDPIQLDKMEDAARAQFADNPRALKATINFLRERKQGVDASRNAREDAIAGNLWKAVASGAPLAQLRTMPEYLDAPGKVQAQLSDYIVNRAERVASRAAAEESRAYTREQRAESRREREGVYMYYQYAKPDVLGKMSDAQLWALVPSIGERNVARLLEEKNRFKTDPKAIDDFRSDIAVINGVLEQAKIDPNPGKDKPDDRANVAFFLDQVAAEQNRVQGITGKKVGNEELKAIAKRVLGQQVVSRGWFWNSSKPLVNAVIGDVPRSDYNAIAQEFKSRGIAAPTDEQILQAWKLAMASRKR